MISACRAHTSPATRRRRKLRSSSTSSVLRCRIPPRTPIVQWRFHKERSAVDGGTCSPTNFRRDFRRSEISVRKLAAELWQFQIAEVSGDGSFRCSTSKAELQSFPSSLKCSKEEATELDYGDSEASKYTKLLSHSVFSALLPDFLHFQNYINTLKCSHKSSIKIAEELARKLQQERMQRQTQKIQAKFDDLKDEAEKQRRSRERMESLNAKLMQKLSKARQSAKYFMAKYEEERRRRETMGEVCGELAKQIEEDKLRMEELQRESMEMEEEMKMMRVAEMIREEQVHMRQDDAKSSFEDQYNYIACLISYLQSLINPSILKLTNDELYSENAEQFMDQKAQKASSSSSCSISKADNAMNPHVIRGIIGHMEWPRGTRNEDI